MSNKTKLSSSVTVAEYKKMCQNTEVVAENWTGC